MVAIRGRQWFRAKRYDCPTGGEIGGRRGQLATVEEARELLGEDLFACSRRFPDPARSLTPRSTARNRDAMSTPQRVEVRSEAIALVWRLARPWRGCHSVGGPVAIPAATVPSQLCACYVVNR